MLQDPKTKKQQIEENKILSNAILHAVEIKSNFELFAYHVITKETFIKRTQELINLLD